MKNIFIRDIKSIDSVENVISLLGWVKKKRESKNVLFIDLVDSSGEIQIIIEKNKLGVDSFTEISRLPVESAIEVIGNIKSSKKKIEITAKSINIVSVATKYLSPEPRSNFDIFDDKYSNQIQLHKHIYLRNPKFMAIQKFRSLLLHHMRIYFYDNNYIDVPAPIITPLTLYKPETAIPIKIKDQNLFLTQCAGNYLEASAIAFEKVFNISPSFRGEESKSKRHLLEYWHIKAELTFGNLEDIIKIVESIIKYLTENLLNEKDIDLIFKDLGTKFCKDGLKIPFPRINYTDAIKHLQNKGFKIKFGESIGALDEELALYSLYNSPFWIVGIPRSIEPYPYTIDENDNRLTKTADLIASNGYGELLGVAEKIYQYNMLKERLLEKEIFKNNNYHWIKELHQFGSVPHIAFGMGVERLIRWMMNIPNVKDAHPFPRTFKRKITI